MPAGADISVANGVIDAGVIIVAARQGKMVPIKSKAAKPVPISHFMIVISAACAFIVIFCAFSLIFSIYPWAAKMLFCAVSVV